MHAELQLNPSVLKVVEYHEKKVKKNVAECIWAENFIKDAAALSYEEKVYPFELRASYNDSVKKKMFHSALQFDGAGEISNATMVAVAREYMAEMGYGDEPYLVYRHRDATREHLHLVASNIDRAGAVIGISRHALLRSSAVTERLTEKYGLDVNATEKATTIAEALKDLPKGLGYLFPAMNRVLEKVVPNYRYTNLGELNAVLRLHDLHASRGKEGSITYERKGLHYHPLNAEGQPIKEYLPARRFPSRPTLGELEKRFVANAELREGHREGLAVIVDFVLAGKQLNLDAFAQALRKEKVSLVTGEDKEAGPRMWYVDHANKTVFEGSTIGPGYSFAGMQQRLVTDAVYQQLQESQRQSQRNRPSL